MLNVFGVLRADDGAPESGTGTVFPTAPDAGIFRTDRIGTRDCLARRRLAERASVFGIGVR